MSRLHSFLSVCSANGNPKRVKSTYADPRFHDPEDSANYIVIDVGKNCNESDVAAVLSSIRKLPPFFLRQSAKEYFDENTHQRNDASVNLENGKIGIGNRSFSGIEQQHNSVIGGPSYSIKSVTYNANNGNYAVEFEDEFVTEFSPDWLNLHADSLRNSARKNRSNSSTEASLLNLEHDISPILPRIPWSNMTAKDFRTTRNSSNYDPQSQPALAISFDDLILSDDYHRHGEDALKTLYQYGILLVTNTPTDDEGCGVSAISSALSGCGIKPSQTQHTSPLEHYRYCHKHNIAPLPYLKDGIEGPSRTMYGSIWSTNPIHAQSGASTADSAFTTLALPQHTDMTYLRDPPGLQVFTMVNPADEGGESVYTDGLALAEHMRKYHPTEFDVLCRYERRFRSIDDSMGIHLEGRGPVFHAIDRSGGIDSNAGPDRWGAVLSIRHNDLDRLPDLPPMGVESDAAVDKYYTELTNAHHVLDELISRDEFRLVIPLKKGETVIVANQVRG